METHGAEKSSSGVTYRSPSAQINRTHSALSISRMYRFVKIELYAVRDKWEERNEKNCTNELSAKFRQICMDLTTALALG